MSAGVLSDDNDSSDYSSSDPAGERARSDDEEEFDSEEEREERQRRRDERHGRHAKRRRQRLRRLEEKQLRRTLAASAAAAVAYPVSTAGTVDLSQIDVTVQRAILDALTAQLNAQGAPPPASSPSVPARGADDSVSRPVPIVSAAGTGGADDNVSRTVLSNSVPPDGAAAHLVSRVSAPVQARVYSLSSSSSTPAGVVDRVSALTIDDLNLRVPPTQQRRQTIVVRGRARREIGLLTAEQLLYEYQQFRLQLPDANYNDFINEVIRGDHPNLVVTAGNGDARPAAATVQASAAPPPPPPVAATTIAVTNAATASLR
jgi:hypothetical protein